MKYRTRPEVVDAVEMTRDIYWDPDLWPSWLQFPHDCSGPLFFGYWDGGYPVRAKSHGGEGQGRGLFLAGVRATSVIFVGDFIVRRSNGRLQVHRPDRFHKLFEEVTK